MYNSSIAAKINSSYSDTLHFFSTKPPSSNYAEVIISPVFSWDDVAYERYQTADCVASAFEYVCDMYYNALGFPPPNTTSCDKNIFCVVGTYTRYPLWCCGIPTKIPWKPFCNWWHIFNSFVSTCAVAFHTTHG